MSGRCSLSPPPAGQPRSALPASPRRKGNSEGRRRESTRRALAEPPAGEAGQGCGGAATCPRRGHGLAAFVLAVAAPRGGRAGPGVAAPPRPWLPRQCRRPAPRCRRCPRRPGRRHGQRAARCLRGEDVAGTAGLRQPQGKAGAAPRLRGRGQSELLCPAATTLPGLGAHGGAAPRTWEGGQRREPCSPRPGSWMVLFSLVNFSGPGEALFRVFFFLNFAVFGCLL